MRTSPWKAVYRGSRHSGRYNPAIGLWESSWAKVCWIKSSMKELLWKF